DQLRKYKKNGYRLFNNYGPTENTVVTTTGEISKVETNIPIGKPIANTKVYILDAQEHLQPIGVIGELCISGAGIARGYWQKEDLTKERFVANPYQQGEIMYRTGDMARWLPDGNIEFLGRNDHQAKIRGYRVELTEIEHQLSKYPEIKNCVVTINKNVNGDNSLVAYYIADAEIPVSKLRIFLEHYLPSYFVPKDFIQVNEFPMTVHGKIDIKALPSPKEIVEIEYQSRGNEIEDSIFSLWRELLNTEDIGMDDNFFELGGNSMMIIILHSKLSAIYPGKVKVSDLFAYSTVRKLAYFIAKQKDSDKKLEEIMKLQIKFPQSFIVNKDTRAETQIVNFQIKEEIVRGLTQASKDYQVSIETLMLSSYLYLLSKVSGQEKISIQVRIDADKSKVITANLNDLYDFKELFLQTNRQLKNSIELEWENDGDKIGFNKTINCVIPYFYYQKENKNIDIPSYCDLSITIDDSKQGMNLICQYNKNRIKTKSIEKIIQNYFYIILEIIKKEVF
ncbi:non-ribosomal peptide synthetase, partial [Bacillus cereus group sp. Bce036]|nr:non-ribosomal peptide synthetase [Bacillus cereus]MDA2003037.1 non-ribosomal peptide synthetase [Bacillus cereus]